ncbi:efflux transporter outer membrane subunit [Phenylobacterium immobile]|uniref:efflux transporter outer membrane subunit n=1 Tax=Phenylobacterium immobile TaxID=21 RepID=UPI000B2852BC|nr:efflux transporter outer membrane subunit [Phenylobacterium immobile]
MSPLKPALAALLIVSTALSACATLAPRYERPALAAPQTWPDPAQGAAASAGDLAWRDVFLDAKLQALIDLALANNRDLRLAAANIEQARAQYRIQRAALLPTVNGVLSRSETVTPAAGSAFGQALDIKQASASVNLTSFELDLFGRIRSLSRSALESFFATEENQRAVRISLIAETASAYLQMASDLELMAITRSALDDRDESLRLTRRRFDAGVASDLDLSQAETLAEQARSDLATATALVGQDQNALRLVVGAQPPAALLPAAGVSSTTVLADLPAGMPSDVLTRRPDVLAAEHTLRARNADIGAARAAFFPRIALTGNYGTASSAISGLFDAGTKAWSFAPQIVLPLFAGGANIAGLKRSRAARDAAVATYEKTVQTAFREVADQLAVRSTIRDRVEAQTRLTSAAERAQRLSRARYEAGVDSYITALDANRTLYTARQTLLSARLAEQLNRVTLYKVLGGGAG